MDFLSEQLISSGYRDRLSTDLRQADLCRFLVAYISEYGLMTLGRSELVRLLRNEGSFGLSSLTCACGYKPLLHLQRDVGPTSVLKYFMDPMVKNTDEPDGIVLFHSKLVYLRLPSQGKSVVYIGSHNWSGRALGPGRPRNVEASLRLEFDFSQEHLTGSDTSLPSQVNRHLLSAFEKPACLAATAANETAFEQWYQCGCGRADPSPLQNVAVVLATQKDGTAATPMQWEGLSKHGIYLQVLEEAEGKLVRKSSDDLLVMVWDSRSDLQAGVPPVLLRCHMSTLNAGPTSEMKGTNVSAAPVAGFGAAIYDDAQLRAMQAGSRAQRSSLEIWSGRKVELFDFEFRQQPSESTHIDGGVLPKYRFHLEVDCIVFPTGRDAPSDAKLRWSPESFAVARSEKDVRLERLEGYFVPADLRSKILIYLTEELLIDRRQAKNLPVVQQESSGREGKRISNHPLHDTFLGRQTELHRDEFYAKAKRGSLVAEIDHLKKTTQSKQQRRLVSEVIARVQKVLTSKLESPEIEWASIAKRTTASNEQRKKDHERE